MVCGDWRRRRVRRLWFWWWWWWRKAHRQIETRPAVTSEIKVQAELIVPCGESIGLLLFDEARSKTNLRSHQLFLWDVPRRTTMKATAHRLDLDLDNSRQEPEAITASLQNVLGLAMVMPWHKSRSDKTHTAEIYVLKSTKKTTFKDSSQVSHISPSAFLTSVWP